MVAFGLMLSVLLLANGFIEKRAIEERNAKALEMMQQLPAQPLPTIEDARVE